MNELPLGSLPRISSIPGPRGPKGDKGDPGTNGAAGVTPSTTTTASFVMPASNGAVTVTVLSTAWAVAGIPVYVETAGHFVVATVLSATSFSLTAQTATGNAAAGAVISTGKRVVPGARMTADTSQVDALGGRVTALENGSTAGNRTWYANSAPTNGGGALRTGDLWINPSQSNRIYRWDGTQWVDVQRILELTDFGTGIRPIVKVNSLPTSGYVDGDFVWLNTDGKLYRRVSGSWTKAIGTGDLVGQIDGTMIVDGSLVAQKIAANAITADKIGANQVITQAANIGTGVITDAHVSNLSAGKITAGDIQSVNIGYAGRIFHPTYSTRKFRTVEFDSASVNGHIFGSGAGWTFQHTPGLRTVCPGHALWGQAGYTTTLCPDANGTAIVQIQGRLVGYNGAATVYCRINSGNYVALNSRAADDGDDAIIDTTRRLTGLALTDQVTFYVAPCNANGTIDTSVTCRADIDVICFNW